MDERANLPIVGVVGAGVVGAGVAQCAAQAGHPVVLVDLSDEILARARQSIVEQLHLQRMLGKTKSLPPAAEVLARITCTTDVGACRDAAVIVEATSEPWTVKSAVLPRLDASCPHAAVIASTTSAIPITRLASLTARPARVLGLHFMNPVPLMPVVEMIRGFHTDEAALDAARAFVTQMGKTAILVADSPGFVTNRVLMLTVNEAMFLAAEKVASVEEIDLIFKRCFGHKMGPLETADMIGLDTVLQSIEVLHESFGDSKYRPCPLLRQMVAAGLLGRKSGRGFYDYRGTP